MSASVTYLEILGRHPLPAGLFHPLVPSPLWTLSSLSCQPSLSVPSVHSDPILHWIQGPQQGLIGLFGHSLPAVPFLPLRLVLLSVQTVQQGQAHHAPR